MLCSTDWTLFYADELTACSLLLRGLVHDRVLLASSCGLDIKPHPTSLLSQLLGVATLEEGKQQNNDAASEISERSLETEKEDFLRELSYKFYVHVTAQSNKFLYHKTN